MLTRAYTFTIVKITYLLEYGLVRATWELARYSCDVAILGACSKVRTSRRLRNVAVYVSAPDAIDARFSQTASTPRRVRTRGHRNEDNAIFWKNPTVRRAPVPSLTTPCWVRVARFHHELIAFQKKNRISTRRNRRWVSIMAWHATLDILYK